MVSKPFAASLWATCLATTFLVSPIAHAADPELYFYPKTKWVVEHVEAASKNGKTCTISNQLNNGYIVQLAGTQKGFTNLNIDFRQDIFQKNFKYEVQYTIPGQESIVVPTKAFKENLLVSDLREVKEFSGDLSKASVLDVHIRDNQFRIYMTGLESVMDNYSDCTGKRPAMASVDSDVTQPAPIMAAPSEPIETAETAEVKTDTVNIAAMLEREQQMAGVNAPPPPPMSLAELEAERVQADKPTDKASVRPTKGDKPRYTEILAEQMKQDSKKYQPNRAASENTNMQNDKIVEQMEPEAQSSKTAAEPMKVSSADVPNVTKTNKKSPKANYEVIKHEPIVADFTAPAKKPKSAPEKLARNDVQNTTAASLARIEPTSGTPEPEFVDMRNKISDLEGRIAVLMKKNKMLDEELKDSLTSTKKEITSVSSDNWNLERATMKFNEAERQILRLGRQLQTQRAQCDMEKTELETMLFDPKLTDQQQRATLSSLEGELDATKADLFRQQRQYEERIKVLEAQLNAL